MNQSNLTIEQLEKLLMNLLPNVNGASRDFYSSFGCYLMLKYWKTERINCINIFNKLIEEGCVFDEDLFEELLEIKNKNIENRVKVLEALVERLVLTLQLKDIK